MTKIFLKIKTLSNVAKIVVFSNVILMFFGVSDVIDGGTDISVLIMVFIYLILNIIAAVETRL
jgi:hypothetical protein